MLMKVLGAAASTAILVGASQASAATLVIDAFDGSQWVQDAPVTTNASQVGGANIIGGFRDLAVQNTSADGDNMAATELRVTNGKLKFSNVSGARGEGTLTYDGDDDPTSVNTSGLGGINLLIGTDPHFFFGLPADEPFDNVALFRATVWDTAGNSATYEEEIAPGFSQELSFSEFAGVDFSQIGALQFFISTTEFGISVDGALDSIEVRAGDVAPIPLPASGLLLLGGMGGLTFMRRRKKA
ncbi:VPLPA-CTERM sorting domain-containing protein [Paracoccus sp. SY]|uniref:VPLPA-CTERM sorting domain-containing protein n=1 Tax=Paracoccus sp. SY TaxID=1330255 RepID=UPI000CD16EC6|nr:VPLPA-CTERM sorting domain-containing protein [Paracoccus sp. SY]